MNMNVKFIDQYGEVDTAKTRGHVPPTAQAIQTTEYDAPHEDSSGKSKEHVVATCLAGKHSGKIVMHFTPAEYREYCAGMARLAELG